MGILSAFVGEVLAILTYAVLFAGVYKLFQIHAVLGEIKEVLSTRAHSPAAPAVSLAPGSPEDLRTSDDASEYAAKLLRAVNAETPRAASETPVAPEAH